MGAIPTISTKSTFVMRGKVPTGLYRNEDYTVIDGPPTAEDHEECAFDGDEQFRQDFESITENRQERRKNQFKVNANDDVYALAA